MEYSVVEFTKKIVAKHNHFINMMVRWISLSGRSSVRKSIRNCLGWMFLKRNGTYPKSM